MSTSPTPSTTRSKKLLVPKVWKRPHSTIYGKNVEFGSSLYSDKIGEINGRKFNSELPWTVRNSGGSSTAGSVSGSYNNQGYLSSQNNSSLLNNGYDSGGANSVDSYAKLLEMTNPSRNSRRLKIKNDRMANNSNKRIDFYDNLVDFNKQIDELNNSSLLLNEPLLSRKVFDNFLDFDYELGLFVPNHDHDHYDNSRVDRRSASIGKKADINTKSFVPLQTTTLSTTHSINKLLPKHQCQLESSPYGQSSDGRKLSLGSINPASYRPSLPHKTTTAHASDGEEFEFQDKSSPFYTDRWAGKTIRHFDSDLYSNANLFKSMIL